MRKVLIALLALFIVNVSLAQDKGVRFEKGTLEQALKKAKKEKKLVFLDCYTSWCGPCKSMADNVFPLEEMGNYFNPKFVNIKIDMEKGEGPALAKKYRITGYPTFLILDVDGSEKGRVLGGNYAPTFIKSVKNALDPTKQPEYLKKQYEAKKNIETGFAYLEVLNGTSKEYSAIVEELYFILPDKDRYTPQFFDCVFKTLKGLSDPMLVDICAKKYSADRFLGADKTTAKIKNYLTTRLIGYCTSTKIIFSEDELKQTAMLLGALAPNYKEVSAHVGNVALLKYKKDTDGMIKYFKQYVALIPTDGRVIIDNVLVNLAQEPTTTKEQKERIKEYFQVSANVTNTLYNSLVKRIEEIKL